MDDSTPKYIKETHEPEPMEAEPPQDANDDKTPDYKNSSKSSHQSPKNQNAQSNSPPRNDPSNSLLSMMGCRSVDNYQKVSRVQEGTYGVVCNLFKIFASNA
jgi:hypothetical protein